MYVKNWILSYFVRVVGPKYKIIRFRVKEKMKMKIGCEFLRTVFHLTRLGQVTCIDSLYYLQRLQSVLAIFSLGVIIGQVRLGQVKVATVWSYGEFAQARLGQVRCTRPLFCHMGEFAQARLDQVRYTRPNIVFLPLLFR